MLNEIADILMLNFVFCNPFSIAQSLVTELLVIWLEQLYFVMFWLKFF